MKTWIKAISWEFFSNILCFFLAYLMFGNIGTCLVFTGICVAFKIILFYIHESLWSKNQLTSEELAKLFHETYEKLAPSFGYTTRTDTRKFNQNSPNAQLMIATCSKVLEKLND